MADDTYEELFGDTPEGATSDAAEGQEPDADEPKAEVEEGAEAGASKKEEPDEPEQAAAEQEDPRDAQIRGLKTALSEAREKNRAPQSEAQKEPEKAPDMFEDPEGYKAHVQRQVQGTITQQKLEMSRFHAEREFGKEEVQAAFEYFNDHPQESAALMREASPFHAAVEAYRKAKFIAEVGSDPAAYRAQVKAEILKEIQAEQAAKEVKTTPSLANETSVGGRTPPAPPSFTDLDELL